MADEVKLYADRRSPFSCRVKIALNLKGIKYQNIEEDLSNKSADLIKYNPVYKKVPVLVHNEKPVSESLVIVEYIGDWKGVPILPHDPYERAAARFLAKFIDDKCLPALYKVFKCNGEEQVIAEACEQLHILENELALKAGKKFFGGENINLVDIAAAFIGYWLGSLEQVSNIQFFTRIKFPKLVEWANAFVECQVVKEILPPKEAVLAFYKKWLEDYKI
ncbi:probable glutathione S-transferase [Rutidosis leptorrhynchoides]|uniref:probable glutathione S-transferase n=1 Tax=Rutidosis leptorrhynchoides TaxID=125765 RepID=UPI003A9A04A6